MDKDILKQSACRFIDENREKIIGWAREIDRHPELGFKETKTSHLVESVLGGLGLPVRKGIAVTGVEGVLTGARPGPGLLIMGEMDSVVNRDYPGADPVTGAAHLCGHHLQVAIMLGAALGLTSAGADREMSGKIFFLGTPAEEFVEIEERLRFRDEANPLSWGKQELVRLGYLANPDGDDRPCPFGSAGKEDALWRVRERIHGQVDSVSGQSRARRRFAP
jgi:hypothetical protein